MLLMAEVDFLIGPFACPFPFPFPSWSPVATFLAFKAPRVLRKPFVAPDERLRAKKGDGEGFESECWKWGCRASAG